MAITAILFCLLIEGASCAGVRLVAARGGSEGPGLPVSAAGFRELIRAVIDGPERALDAAPRDAALDRHVIHPYMGYVAAQHRDVNAHGFLGASVEPIQERSEPRLIVAVLGGSFAQQLVEQAGETVRQELAVLGKQIVLLNLAVGGYKQPQQLLALSYLLSLGAEFDVVVNLDGFNEVALPLVENVRKGVFPYYPRRWYWRSQRLFDEQALLDLAEARQLDRHRKSWAGLFDGPQARSMTMCLLWLSRDLRLVRKRREIELRQLARSESRGEDYAVSGPPYPYVDPQRLASDLAAHWARSSRLMAALCRGNGIRYLHFLQPNQYVEGSKPMGRRERGAAVDPEHPYREGVVVGYPSLRRQGAQIARRGVEFRDLTQVFAEHPEILYADRCCHLNERGYRVVAQAIAQAVLDVLSRPPGRPADPAAAGR